MDYVSRVPAPPLDRFIDDIYCLTVRAGLRSDARRVISYKPCQPEGDKIRGERARRFEESPWA